MNPLACLIAIGETIDACVYHVQDGCIQNEDYCDHKRAKNWVAVVRPDVSQPGGLARVFCPHGSGRWYILPSTLAPGEIIEMAGDYYTARGAKQADRRYLLVHEVHETHVVCRFIGTRAPSRRAVDKIAAEIAAWCAS